MKDLTNSIIVWKRNSEAIQVVPLGTELPHGFSSWGAGNNEVDEATNKGRRIALLRKFVMITARDGIPARNAYRALCELKEFDDLVGML